MKRQKMEDLLLQSLDGNLNKTDRSILEDAIKGDINLVKSIHDFTQIREMLTLKSGQSFGPFFAERVISNIKNLQQEVGYQLLSSFKKYWLAPLGLVILLLTLNIVLSDDLTLQSIIGLEENNIQEIVQIDLYEDLTE